MCTENVRGHWLGREKTFWMPLWAGLTTIWRRRVLQLSCPGTRQFVYSPTPALERERVYWIVFIESSALDWVARWGHTDETLATLFFTVFVKTRFFLWDDSKTNLRRQYARTNLTQLSFSYWLYSTVRKRTWRANAPDLLKLIILPLGGVYSYSISSVLTIQ